MKRPWIILRVLIAHFNLEKPSTISLIIVHPVLV